MFLISQHLNLNFTFQLFTQTSFATDCKPPNDFTEEGGPLFGLAHADDEDDDVRSE